MVRPRDPRRRRSTGSSLLVEPSSPTSNQIPLNVLPRSFIQSSSSESSQSSSSTPPSSAEGATTETRPYLENGNPVTSAATPPSSSEVHSTTSNPTQTPISTSIVQSPVAGDNVNRAVQAEQEQQSSPVTIASRPWWLGVGRWISKRSWFQSTLGISSLIFTMISLFIYGLRSYEMAKWSERNDLMQMCAGLIQVTLLEASRAQTYSRLHRPMFLEVPVAKGFSGKARPYRRTAKELRSTVPASGLTDW